MSTCTIIIKIKDYFPKVDSIPYENFICLFTCGENEGQLPLISQENEIYQHQMKNVTSDIKYKVHVLDYNDMSLIGMCEMTIPYNIISQIKPPNGFIQEQQKKLLIDINTKRKLFGTILNMGDIYINIYSEIYLNEVNNGTILKNCKSTNRKKMNNKKLDGSPKTVKKKQLIMKMNSDRQAMMNLNKNTLNNLNNLSHFDIQQNYNSNHKREKNDKNENNNIIKPNNSFNYREIKRKDNKNDLMKIDYKNNNTNIRENRKKSTKNQTKSKDKNMSAINSKQIILDLIIQKVN